MFDNAQSNLLNVFLYVGLEQCCIEQLRSFEKSWFDETPCSKAIERHQVRSRSSLTVIVHVAISGT